jgi:hypothetical protein
MTAIAQRFPPWEALGRAAQLTRLIELGEDGDLDAVISDDRQRFRLLERLRWPNGFRCGRCDVQATPERPRPGILVCARCRSFVGVTARTPLAGEIAIDRWLALFWRLACGDLDLDRARVAAELDIADVAADEVVFDLRQILMRAGFRRVRELVELDARAFDLGGIHVLLLVAVEREPSRGALGRDHAPGAIAIRRVPNLSAEVVRGFVCAVVQPGSSIFTDCWSNYIELQTLPFLHEPGFALPGSLSAVDEAVAELRASLRGRVETLLDLDHGISQHAFARNRIARHSTGQVFVGLLASALGLERQPKLRSGVRRKDG